MQKLEKLRNNPEPDLLVSRQYRTHIDVLSRRFSRLLRATLRISFRRVDTQPNRTGARTSMTFARAGGSIASSCFGNEWALGSRLRCPKGCVLALRKRLLFSSRGITCSLRRLFRALGSALSDTCRELCQHGSGLVDNIGIPTVQSVNQPTNHGQFGKKLSARQKVQVLLGTSLLVGLVEAL